MRRVGKLLLTGALALVAMGLIGAPGAAASIAPPMAPCARATDIEAIVDDSGSMAFTDENRLRVQALDLLINTLSPATDLGAVEFGSELFEQPAADTVFGPEPVGSNAAAMKAALDQKIQADNGATDYNAAFAQSDADNPNADARIFLTDGGHNVGTYNEGHLAHKVPTYVIGFSSGLASTEDQARLQKIAADTGGRYFPLEDSSQLQAVMNRIAAALTCQTPPRQFTDLLGQGQSKSHSVAVRATAKAVQITLTWASPLDRFKLVGLRIVGGGETLATASARHRRPSRLKVRTTTSSTFVVLKVSHLRKGKLRFAVKAAQVGSGAPKALVTTQVSQSSHR
ncbi:MAG TPA: vWA domain-containing protein [Solirubrobacterales bacterium]|nr:vWA domain-containing protein [Solirubrobacterales bacterium]